jgi:UrcA family protein
MNSNIKTDNRPFLACSTAMLLACVLAASNAFADDQVRSETVKFADLKVDTPAGAEALYRRISAAAQRVCRYEASSIYGPSTWQNCVRPTVDATVARVNKPRLTALHAGRKPAPATAMINK